MIGATGRRTAFVSALEGLTGCPAGEVEAAIAAGATRFVLAAGLLRARRAEAQTAGEIAEGWAVNYRQPMELCETILGRVEDARICVLGSESGYRGSYDGVYAAAKAALHRYVETRQAGPRQQLVAVSPHIVADAGMTLRRPDYAQVMALGRQAPRGRWVAAREVASIIRWLLWSDEGLWVSNTVVRCSSASSPPCASGPA